MFDRDNYLTLRKPLVFFESSSFSKHFFVNQRLIDTLIHYDKDDKGTHVLFFPLGYTSQSKLNNWSMWYIYQIIVSVSKVCLLHKSQLKVKLVTLIKYFYLSHTKWILFNSNNLIYSLSRLPIKSKHFLAFLMIISKLFSVHLKMLT